MNALAVTPAQLTVVVIVLVVILAVSIVFFFLKHNQRRYEVFYNDLDINDEIPIIRLGVTKEDLGPGTSKDRFRAYIIKYIEGDPIISRRFLLSEDKEICTQYIASIQHNLRLSFCYETGEPLFIDGVNNFCQSVYDELKKRMRS